MMPTAEALKAHNEEIARKPMGPIWMDETYEIPMKYSAYDITNELKNKLGL